MASLVNGFLSGFCLALSEHELVFGPAIAGSFIFSAPLVFFVGLVTFIAHAFGKKGAALFQLTLQATLAMAVLGGLFFIILSGNEFGITKYAVAICIIVSALLSVLFFHKNFKTNE